MQVFSKDLIARNQNHQIRDSYEEEVENTQYKVVTMEKMSFTEYSSTKEALQYYSRGAVLAVLGLLTSAITYPLSVRIVKRLFGLRDFLNIHLAALPIIININAFVLGVSQGYINQSYLTRRYLQDAPQTEVL